MPDRISVPAPVFCSVPLPDMTPSSDRITGITDEEGVIVFVPESVSARLDANDAVVTSEPPDRVSPAADRPRLASDEISSVPAETMVPPE